MDVKELVFEGWVLKDGWRDPDFPEHVVYRVPAEDSYDDGRALVAVNEVTGSESGVMFEFTPGMYTDFEESEANFWEVHSRRWHEADVGDLWRLELVSGVTVTVACFIGGDGLLKYVFTDSGGSVVVLGLEDASIIGGRLIWSRFTE